MWDYNYNYSRFMPNLHKHRDGFSSNQHATTAIF